VSSVVEGLSVRDLGSYFVLWHLMASMVPVQMIDELAHCSVVLLFA
jgi:hypothetical protein